MLSSFAKENTHWQTITSLKSGNTSYKLLTNSYCFRGTITARHVQCNKYMYVYMLIVMMYYYFEVISVCCAATFRNWIVILIHDWKIWILRVWCHTNNLHPASITVTFVLVEIGNEILIFYVRVTLTCILVEVTVSDFSEDVLYWREVEICTLYVLTWQGVLSPNVECSCLHGRIKTVAHAKNPL